MVVGTDLVRLFVYGLLRDGEALNERLLALGGVAVQLDTPVRGFALYHLGGFPGMVRDLGSTVRGDIFCVPPEALQALDLIEGTPNFYRRVTICAEGGMAQAYLFNQPIEPFRRIESGDWLEAAP